MSRAAIPAERIERSILVLRGPARVKVVVASVMQPTVEYGRPPNASL